MRRRFGTSRCCHAFQGKERRTSAMAARGHVLSTGRGGSAASQSAFYSGKLPPCRPLTIPSPARACMAIPLPGSAQTPNARTRKHWRMQTHHLVLLACCEGVGVLVRVRTRITACALGACSEHAPFTNRGDATADARVRGCSSARKGGGGTLQIKQRLLHTGALCIACTRPTRALRMHTIFA